MHTHSSYPMPLEEANLRVINTLQKKFHCNIGYSGHEVGAYDVCIPAVVLGATSIERHVTLDRTMYGSDQAASLELTGLNRLVGYVKDIESALGSYEKQVHDTEKSIAAKLRKIDTL